MIGRVRSRARSQGAAIVVGGVVDPDLGGRFVGPTVVTGVTNSTTMVREEVFGSVPAVVELTGATRDPCVVW